MLNCGLQACKSVYMIHRSFILQYGMLLPLLLKHTKIQSDNDLVKANK